MTIADVDTPALLLDLDALERNLDRLAAAFGPGSRVRVRPHAKTHKTAIVARMQLERGAIGVCCAKLTEAQALCDGGIDRILITTELVGPAKVERLLDLAGRAEITIVVDSVAGAEPLAAAAARAGVRLRTLVDVDVGQHRAGVAPAAAVELGRFVAAQPGLELAGLQGYEGHLQHVADAAERGAFDASSVGLLAETAAAFARAGLPTGIVTTGGTGTYRFAAENRWVTDVQPGSYAVMDAQYAAVGGIGFAHALTLTTTVISVRDDVAILDAGHKSLSSDGGLPRPLEIAGTFAFAGDEFGALTGARDARLRVGDVVRLVPGHCDTTINLHDRYAVHRGPTIVDEWPIVARGASR